MDNRILVVDINLLTGEEKTLENETIESRLEAKYGCKIFLVDNSRANLQGGLTEQRGIYFIS